MEKECMFAALSSTLRSIVALMCSIARVFKHELGMWDCLNKRERTCEWWMKEAGRSGPTLLSLWEHTQLWQWIEQWELGLINLHERHWHAKKIDEWDGFTTHIIPKLKANGIRCINHTYWHVGFMRIYIKFKENLNLNPTIIPTFKALSKGSGRGDFGNFYVYDFFI